MPPFSMRPGTFLLLSLVAVLASIATSASSNGSSSSGLVQCESTEYASIYNDTNVTECNSITGFSFDYPTSSTVNLTWICNQRSCRQAFQNILSLNASGDCLLINNLSLVHDILEPLTKEPSCYNSTMTSGSSSGTGSGSWDKATAGHSSSSYRNTYGSNYYDPGSSGGMSDSTKAVMIVSITVGALLALVVIVVAVVWYKRQRMRDLHRQAYNDGSALDKLDQDNLDRPARDHNVFQLQVSDMMDTALSTSSQELSFIEGPAHPHHSGSSNHSGTLWNDEELLARHMRSEDIDDIRVIGNGGHGVVYLVRYRQGRLLASKRLVRDQVTRAKTRALITEIKLVAKLDHPNIVQFVGAAWTTEWDLQALFEYMPNGDLCTYLAKTSHEDGVEHWDLEKLQIAMDIVEALVYVHSFAPPLVHRDLKSRNVLLTENTRAKLSDFGVSRFQSDNCTMTTGVGTSRWLAPEVISGGGEYDQSCDIYSMGMVLSEMDTHRLPFSDLRMPSGNPMPEVSILQLVIQNKLKPSFSTSCPQSLRELALRCLAFEPENRPNAIEVSYILRTIAKAEFGV